MTALLEKVLAQVSQMPDTEQNIVASRLLQTLTQFEQEKQKTNSKQWRTAGTASGAYWMSEDFDAPLDDFKEYL